MAVTTLIPHIPDIITSASLASILTLIGVAISNKGNTKRALLQLEHDRIEKSKERELNLKRESYLSFSEKYISAQTAISSMPMTVTALTEEKNNFTSLTILLNKMILLSEENTAIKIAVLYKLMTCFFMDACVKYAAIASIKSMIEINTGFSRKYEKEIERVLASMVAYNENKNKGDVSYPSLNKSFEFNSEQKNNFDSENMKLWVEHNKLLAEFNEFTVTEASKIDDLYNEITIEIRAELGFKVNHEKLKEQLVNNRTDLMLRVKEINKSLLNN
ncbi:hypothetical protein [Serratia fonticola]|uniref:hypothetical protein n=1 Tax=Serratia fonticola TaxID=47917 RepID=UPI002177F951|nr:hypothetical protein [Serratia fonticola]CAI0854991.1 Uncharacterised protein [Serratia fonticola]